MVVKCRIYFIFLHLGRYNIGITLYFIVVSPIEPPKQLDLKPVLVLEVVTTSVIITHR